MQVHALLLKMIVGLISFYLLSGTTQAAGFPEKPIQFLVGWPAGSTNDIMSRAIAKPFSKILGQPVIVQNVPGGGGALVLGRVRSEKPDGYTLFMTGLNMYTQTPLTHNVPFDPLKDFAYLAQHGKVVNYMLCLSDSPWKSFEELIQYVKNNPKKVKYATPGVGTSQDIMMEYLGLKEKLQWIKVPYSSGAEVTNALLGKHVDLAIQATGPEMEYVTTGRFRPLVILSDKRIALLPEVPTTVEKGYDFTCGTSYIWTVSANTPKDIQKILEKALLQAIADREVIDVINKLNKIYEPLGSEALTKAAFSDYEKSKVLMKELGLGIFKK